MLWLGAPLIVILFDAKGETATLLVFLCHLAGLMWLFLGGIFVANAAYNNLGYPFLSALFNWGRATLGTLPFVTLGARYHGPEGGFVGMIVGAALFGLMGSRVVVRRRRTAGPAPRAGLTIGRHFGRDACSTSIRS